VYLMRRMACFFIKRISAYGKGAPAAREDALPRRIILAHAFSQTASPWCPSEALRSAMLCAAMTSQEQDSLERFPPSC
jgi:hypothetical protein